MSSLVSRNLSDDDNLPFADLASICFDDTSYPFQYAGLSFEELPRVAQKFLADNIERFPSNLSQEELGKYFKKLLDFRGAQQRRLARTLEGVHRAIVSGMIKSRTKEQTETDDPADTLREVLIPEWRSHMHDYVDRIDALIWFEMEMRKDTAFELGAQDYIQERKDDVERMITFVVQSLQVINDTVKREMLAERLLTQFELNAEEGQEPGGHLSDGGSSSGSDDYDESLFSDSEVGHDEDCSLRSDSDGRWLNVEAQRMAFNRIV